MFFHPTLSEVTFDTVIDITSQMSEHSWGSIREYLRFCAHAFFLDKDYSYGVPHKIAKAPLPPYYSKEERLRLEKAPDRTTAIGKRDYAIIFGSSALIVGNIHALNNDVCL